jgi:hypothetical protein
MPADEGIGWPQPSKLIQVRHGKRNCNGSLSLRLQNPCWIHIAFPAVTKEEYVGALSARALSIE